MEIRPLEIKDIMTYINWTYEDPFYNFQEENKQQVYEITVKEIDCHFGLYDNELIGIYEFHPKGNEMEIGIALKPERCNQHFGREFIYLGLKYAREYYHFTGEFVLDVASHNHKAIHLYESLGFRYERSFQQDSWGRPTTFLFYRKPNLKHIIFDNGNVLSLFSPDYVVSKYFNEDKDLIKQVVFSQIWNDLDQNIITEEDALKRWKEQIPEKYHAKLEEMFIHWHEHLVPKEEMYQYMLEIKDRYDFYLLSNAPVRHQVFKIPALKLMKGSVVSYELKVNKPDPQIYLELFHRYHLDAKECLMIDDKKENIDEAIHQGMNGFIYHDNIEELKKYIEYIGV